MTKGKYLGPGRQQPIEKRNPSLRIEGSRSIEMRDAPWEDQPNLEGNTVGGHSYLQS